MNDEKKEMVAFRISKEDLVFVRGTALAIGKDFSEFIREAIMAYAMSIDGPPRRRQSDHETKIHQSLSEAAMNNEKFQEAVRDHRPAKLTADTGLKEIL